MKKLALIAPIAMAFAAGAFAQVRNTGEGPVTSSSVTMFGVVDVAVAWGDGSLSHKTQLLSNGNASSRLGFRGFEELGGGLAAGMWLEMGMNVDDGTGVATNANNQSGGASGPGGLTFNRRSTVSLISADWGELRLGRDYVSTFRNRDHTDPFATNGVGSSQVDDGTIAGVTAVRASNMVAYYLPAARLGGLFGEVQYYMGENPSNAANQDDGNGWQARIGYARGPWGVALAGGVTNFLQSASTGDVKVWNVGAHWDLGVARLTAGYFEDKVERIPTLKGTGYIVGAVIPFGTDEFKASFSSYGTDAPGDPRTHKVALGYVHNLSKRTALYATYGHLDNRGPATASLNGSTTEPGKNSDGLDLGLRHSF